MQVHHGVIMTKKLTMFNRDKRTSLGSLLRTGFVTEYGAEDKFAAAVAAHDSAWLEHKELCAEQKIKRLEDKGVTADQKLLSKELEQLEKSIAHSAYRNDGWLNARQLELSQYGMVINIIAYRALCKLQK